MGIYDRGYYQEEEPPPHWIGGRSLVVNLIILNVAIWLIDVLIDVVFGVPGPGASNSFVESHFGLWNDLLTHPWQIYQVLTSGFVHSCNQPAHVLFNMLGLWFFGCELETLYGRIEFLRMYLTAIVLASLAWLAFNLSPEPTRLAFGASGAVMAVVAVYVFNFPRRTLLIMGILPVPAWAAGALYVLYDVAYLNSSDGVGHIAHLAGFAYGFLYFKTRWTIGRFLPRRVSWPKIKPKLRIHEPEPEVGDLNEQVDRILEKITLSGEASLTKKERQTLEKASRRYQQRRD